MSGSEGTGLCARYSKAWMRYVAAVDLIDCLCGYVNRTLKKSIPPDLCLSRKGSPVPVSLRPVRKLGRQMWLAALVSSDRVVLLRQAIFDLIKIGNGLDADVVRAACSFVECDVDAENKWPDYHRHFEQPLLEHLRSLYSSQPVTSLQEYCDFVYRMMAAEEKRFSPLPHSTRDRISSVLSTALISERSSKIRDMLFTALNAGDDTSLKWAYKLLRDSEDLGAVLTDWAKHTLDSSASNTAVLGSVAVRALRLVEVQCEGKPELVRAVCLGLSRSLESMNRGVERLLDLVHSLLSSQNPDLECLEGSISLLGRAPDQGAMQTRYLQKLAERLFSPDPHLDLEARALDHFAAIATPEAAFRVRTMLADVQAVVSHGTLETRILTANAWDLLPQPLQPSFATLLPSLHSQLEDLGKRYRAEHQRRRLEFLPEYSRFQISFASLGTVYELTVSPLQLAVLLSFQCTDQVEVTALLERLQVPAKRLTSLIKPFVAIDLLFNRGDVLEFNNGFTHHKRRLRLPVAPELRFRSTVATVDRPVQAGAGDSYALQAQIMRTLKEHRSLTKAHLLQMFGSSAASALDVLVEREYLEFREKTSLYVYLP